MPNAYPVSPERRSASIVLTVLVHAALLLGWQAAHQAPPATADAPSRTIQWLRLPAQTPDVAPATAPARPTRPEPPRAPQAPSQERRLPAAAPAVPVPVPAAGAALPVQSPATAPAAPGPETPAPAAGVLQRALRDAGAVDKALRKENRPYIVAPLDSPQLRLRKGIEAAADLVPNKWYEAPKTVELVNNTGDGARRTRVVGSRRTYCVTERATNTNVEMIEMHGKLRITNCPTDETPANAQGWRTARD